MEIGTIEFARLLEEPTVVKEGNYSPTWKGAILTSSKFQLNAYIKIIPPEEFFAEVFCSLLGKCISLPIPASFIIYTGNFLKDHSLKNGFDLAFGSSDKDMPSFTKWLGTNSKNQDEIDKLAKEKLKDWEFLHRTAAFDGWVANYDRHNGNILYSGLNNFFVIDHGHSFSGPGWSKKNLDSNLPISNRLLQIVKDLGTTEKNKMLAEIGFVREWIGINIGTVGLNSQSNHYGAGNFVEKIVSFISERSSNLETRLRLELGGLPL